MKLLRMAADFETDICIASANRLGAFAINDPHGQILTQMPNFIQDFVEQFIQSEPSIFRLRCHTNQLVRH